MARGNRRKRREASGPPGAPEWIVTFTDMISLLVTFFVLLMTFSSLEAYDKLKVDAWLGGNKGLHKSRGWVLPDLPADDILAFYSVERGAFRPHSRPAEKLPDSLEQMGQRLTEEYFELDVNQVRDGLVIEFDEDCCFDPGSTALTPELRRSLEDLGEVLQNYPHLVVVEGFTDDAFRPTAAFSSADELSLACARAAADYMLAETGMNPKLLQLSGHGSEHPRADNVSLSGRRLNRRVQIRILSLSKLRSTYLDAELRKEED